MNMLHWTLPRETEAGNPGEEPAKGYRGQAHQTMRAVLTGSGRRGVAVNWCHALLMPHKTQKNSPQTCVQGTGRATEICIYSSRNIILTAGLTQLSKVRF